MAERPFFLSVFFAILQKKEWIAKIQWGIFKCSEFPRFDARWIGYFHRSRDVVTNLQRLFERERVNGGTIALWDGKFRFQSLLRTFCPNAACNVKPFETKVNQNTIAF